MDRKYNAALFCISFFLMCISPLAPFSFFYPKADTSAYLYVGRMFSQGFLPYSYVWDNKGPVLYWFIAFGYKVAFGNVVGVWIIESLILFLTSAFIYFSLIRFHIKPLIAFCSAVLVVFGTVLMFNDGLTCEQLGNFFASISLYIGSKYKKKESGFYWQWGQLFFIGILFSLALFVRVNITSMWIAFGACIIIYKFSRGLIKEAIIYIVSFSLGVLVVFSLICGIFFVNNGLDDMFFAIWQSSHALATKPLYIRFSEGIKTFFNIPFYGWAIVVSYLVAAFIRILSKAEKYPLIHITIFLWLCINIFANSVSGFSLNQYTVSYILITAISFCFLFIWLLPQNLNRYNYYSLIIVTTIFIISNKVPTFTQKLIESTLRDGKENNPVADYIINNTTELDQVASVGFMPEISYLTNRRSPSKYFYILTNNAMNKENTAIIAEELFKDIIAKKPKIIVESPNTRHFINLVWDGIVNVYEYTVLIDSEYEAVFEFDGTTVYRFNGGSL